MTFAPFWAGGLALAAVAVGHFLLTGRHVGVSGRVGALVDRLRARLRGAPPEPTQEELVAALRAMTLEEYGESSVEDAPAEAPSTTSAPSAADHGAFFAGLVLGGLASGLALGASAVAGLGGAGFEATFGGGPGGLVALFVGGLLVGFGTRMAGGCTSGHGLVGVSSLSPGSLLATCCFFGAGILASVALEVLR